MNCPDSTIMPNGMFNLSINLLHVPDNERAFLSFFHNDEVLESLPEPGMLLDSIALPGFDYVYSRSDFSEETERNIRDVLHVLDTGTPPGLPEIPPRVERERLTGLFVAIFRACLFHSRLFLVPGNDEVWNYDNRMDFFYMRVVEEVKARGIEGGGFALLTGNDEVDSLNPGALWELDIDAVEEIVKYITLTRITNVERQRPGEAVPQTELTQLVDDWIRRAAVIYGTRQSYIEDSL
ncbi:uncharacterized protein GGS22DRAFT_189514 [Annulohypoxylon maeteangense]|uniref:uncharacterized protein n=1 Tax=Annulohypoxylon maeteangense TaxID=1927788 RepID=UPI002008D9B8|nr:uncharacterized protein GGS22DRAFT_189514 [Annulohypoxylon maeteangense]KAI0884385.1 hypothetical protein GGS22DRAFT_189514 [Annulohypoxylon maeteangense]